MCSGSPKKNLANNDSSTSSRVHYRRNVIYRADSRMKRPLQLLQELWWDLLGCRGLAWQLMKRDIRAQYRQSFLGISWALIPPIFAAVGFTFATKSNVLNVGETDLPYPAYVMFSTSLWQAFVESVTLPIQNVANAKAMLAKISFPREALILAGAGQVLFNFIWKLILIIVLFIWFKMPITISAILAPVALLHLIVLGTAIGTFLAPMAALYSDFSKGIPLVMGTLIFFTPVIYPLPSGDGFFGVLVKLNPVTPLLVTTRELATTGVISDPIGFWIASALAFGSLLVTWIVYKLAIPYAVERMSA